MAAPSAQAITRHPHLSTSSPKGWVRVDMHSHTLHSGDSTTTIDEIVEAVQSAGIDVLCITDHNAIAGAKQLADILEREGICRVIVGSEVKTQTGEVIGLFLKDRIPFGAPAVETAQAIRAQDALVYVPHPFDVMRRNLAESSLNELASKSLLDAVEIFNAKTSLPSLNVRAEEFAKQHDLAGGVGSDAHVPLAIGAAFIDMPDFDGPQEFLDSLRRGIQMGHHWDEPRPWTPRIVPSIAYDEFNGD